MNIYELFDEYMPRSRRDFADWFFQEFPILDGDPNETEIRRRLEIFRKEFFRCCNLPHLSTKRNMIQSRKILLTENEEKMLAALTEVIEEKMAVLTQVIEEKKLSENLYDILKKGVPKNRDYPENSVQCDGCGGWGCEKCGDNGWLTPVTHPGGRRCGNCNKPLAPGHWAVYCSNECAAEDVD